MGNRGAHTDCVKIIPTIQLYSQVEPEIAHSEGDTSKLSVRNKIPTLIEKWEEPGEIGVMYKGVPNVKEDQLQGESAKSF